jgi:4-hydroxybenzoate polyprenyltransferase
MVNQLKRLNFRIEIKVPMNAKNLAAYLGQRFPVVNMALFAILFGTVYSVATFFSPASAPFGWRELLGMGATISFFFRLRVFDEIKDYALDAVNHPHRVLQSGRVTLRQLVTLSLVASTLEVAWSLLMGWPTVVCWLAALGYSLLMRYEFFVGSYLKKSLVLYAFTHMLIMPLVILWIWSGCVPGFGLSVHLGVLAALSLLGGFSFEIARKIHAPDAERELVDSYSKSLGYAGAILTVLTILLAGVAVQGYLLFSLRAGLLPFLVIGLLYLLTLLIYLRSLSRPREKTLKLAELLVSLFMLVSYLSIILEANF